MTRAIPPVRRLLLDAKALIDKPEKWCKSAFARTSLGVATHALYDDATRFCLVGALMKADIPCTSHYLEARAFLTEAGGKSVMCLNDAPTTTHRMIMALFNRAIKRAKEQGI